MVRWNNNLRRPWAVFFAVAVAFFGAAPLDTRAQDVLVLDTGTLNQTAALSVAALGYDAQLTSTTAAFADALYSAGPWDLVVIEVPNQFVGDDIAFVIDSLVAGGGRVILSYFSLDAYSDGEILRNAFGVLEANDYFAPQELTPWDVSHPVFNTPNPIGAALAPAQDAWLDDGDELTPVTGAAALGGFAGSPAPGVAGIVIANGDRTICNGFLFDSYTLSEAAALLANEMVFLLAGATTGAPDFTRGDSNGDGAFNIADAIFVLASLFVPGSPAASCADAADTNDDGVLNIADAIFALSALFAAGATPPAPYPNCGPDTSLDSLDCADFAACP